MQSNPLFNDGLNNSLQRPRFDAFFASRCLGRESTGDPLELKQGKDHECVTSFFKVYKQNFLKLVLSFSQFNDKYYY